MIVVKQRTDETLKTHINKLLSISCASHEAFVIEKATFAEVFEKAAHLRQVFLEDDPPYACLCTEEKEVVTAALIASLAGGPALILPHAFSLPVLSEIKKHSGYAHIVTDVPREVPDGVRCIVPEKSKASWPSIDTLTPRAPEDQWVRLFTGGSTGAPKMWTKTVRNLLTETLSIIADYHVTPRDRLAASVSPIHIYGLLYGILTPLFASAAVAGPSPSFPGEIETVLLDTNASIFISVPAHFRALNGHPFTAPNLRLAFSSAGMLPEEDAAAFTTRTGAPVAEIYGSTETGGIAARVRTRGETDFKPFNAIEVRIENQQLKLRSDYISNELRRDKDGFFIMGDRAAATHNGRFSLLGRADGIVKVGGKRVDLEAVAEQIRALPMVNNAAVVALPVDSGRENQIAAVIETDLETFELNRMLAAKLEPCSRPRRVKIIDKIPITSAGKYDRKTVENLFVDGA